MTRKFLRRLSALIMVLAMSVSSLALAQGIAEEDIADPASQLTPGVAEQATVPDGQATAIGGATVNVEGETATDEAEHPEGEIETDEASDADDVDDDGTNDEAGETEAPDDTVDDGTTDEAGETEDADEALDDGTNDGAGETEAPDDTVDDGTTDEAGDADDAVDDGTSDEAGETEAPDDAVHGGFAGDVEVDAGDADDELADGDTEDDGAAEDEEAPGDAPLGYGYTVSITDDGIMLTKVVTDCTHESTTKGSGIIQYDADPINERQHQLTYQPVTFEQCDNCGLYVSYEPGDRRTEVADHDYSSYGSCSVCYYDCPHSVADEDWSLTYTDDAYYSINEEMHQKYTAERYEGTCTICGATVYEEYYTKAGEPEPHNFYEDEAGTWCYDCGDYSKPAAQPECPGHPEGHSYVETSRKILDTGDMDPSYQYLPSRFKPNDDNTHIRCGYSLELIFECSNCGNTDRRMEYHPDEEITEEHVLSWDNICIYCGYVSVPSNGDNACTHPNLYVSDVEFSDEFITDAPIENNGNGTHTGKLIKTTRYRCPDCDYDYSEQSVVSGTTACEYEWQRNEDTGIGYDICPVCGAIRCDHPNLETQELKQSPDFVDDVVATDLKDGTHQWSYYYLEEEYYCPDCHNSFNGTKSERVDEPLIESHNFSSPAYDDGDSRCFSCGAVNECPHKNVHTSTVEEQQENYQYGFTCYGYRPKDAESHYAIHSLYKYCEDCNTTLEEWYETVVEPHDWSDGVVCPCRAVKCVHLHTTPKVDTTTTYAERPGDDKQHDVITATTTTQICDDCGEPVSTETTQEVTQAAHDYDENGVCTVAGCNHACSHADKSYGTPVPDSYKADDAQHTPSTNTPWTCNSCGTAGSDYNESGTPEKHTYVLQDDGSYKCSVCEHVCGHANAEVTLGDPTNESFDTTATTHTRKYQQAETTTCPDCTYTATKTLDKSDEPANHSWVEGVCSVCKYACVHEWGEDAENTVWGEYDASAVTPEAHTQLGVKSTTHTCTVCGVEEKTKPDENVTQQSPHDWSAADGVCTDCGYECVHEDYEPVPEPGVFVPTGDWKPNGASGHTRPGRIETHTSCGNCGALIDTQVTDESATQTEKHNIADGVCTVCGYKVSTDDNRPKLVETSAEAEPAFTAVDAGMYGLSTGTRMATTLCQAVQGIQVQYGVGVPVTIWKVAELIGSENARVLAGLPAQEQVLVVLSVLGYDDEVNATLTELNLTLSAEATQLIDACKAYTASLTSDALTAYNDAKAKYFPEGTLTLEITYSGVTRLERYSFTFQDGIWVYTGLATA